MLKQEDNDKITRSGPGTPLGNLLRSYWQPAGLVSEMPGDRPVKQVRIMSEDLVLFKKRQGWGLISRYCAHRGVDLSYGRLEADGIRCLYHGWLYDGEGRCVEQPAEPEHSQFLGKIADAARAAPKGGWVFVACDVGQGDALVLPAAAHTGVVVDAGPDPVAVDRCLRDLGITDVALLVFSHYHLDHVGGLAGVLHGRRVGRVITGPLADPLSGVDLVHDQLAAHGRTITTAAVGTSYTVGAVHLEVLAPDRPYRDTRSDPNNSSLVVRASVGDVRILLSGDVEVEAQQAMLDSHVDVRADVMKVPHHGSAYSDPDFLAAVHARVGVISVGLGNDYGHPSPVLLDELARLGVPVRRTDRDGDVAVTGPRARLAAVVRGVAASTAAGGVRVRAAASVPSVPGARMEAWQPGPPVPSPSTICPTRCPGSSCSSVMRNCWSAAASARSPPPPVGPIPTSSRPSAPAPRSTDPNCTNCSVRRCSATPG